MKCPKCKQTEGEFRVGAWEINEMWWYLDANGEVSYTRGEECTNSGVFPKTEVHCMECSFIGILREFTIKRKIGFQKVRPSPPMRLQDYSDKELQKENERRLIKTLNAKKKGKQHVKERTSSQAW